MVLVAWKVSRNEPMLSFRLGENMASCRSFNPVVTGSMLGFLVWYRANSEPTVLLCLTGEPGVKGDSASMEREAVD